jgi:hypothetical protein
MAVFNQSRSNKRIFRELTDFSFKRSTPDGPIRTVKGHFYMPDPTSNALKLETYNMTELMQFSGSKLPALLEHEENSQVGVIKKIQPSKRKYGLAASRIRMIPREEVGNKRAWDETQDGLKSGKIRGLSIGFHNSSTRGKRLLEISFVRLPLEPQADIYSLRASDAGEEEIGGYCSLLKSMEQQQQQSGTPASADPTLDLTKEVEKLGGVKQLLAAVQALAQENAGFKKREEQDNAEYRSAGKAKRQRIVDEALKSGLLKDEDQSWLKNLEPLFTDRSRKGESDAFSQFYDRVSTKLSEHGSISSKYEELGKAHAALQEEHKATKAAASQLYNGSHAILAAERQRGATMGGTSLATGGGGKPADVAAPSSGPSEVSVQASAVNSADFIRIANSLPKTLNREQQAAYFESWRDDTGTAFLDTLFKRKASNYT